MEEEAIRSLRMRMAPHARLLVPATERHPTPLLRVLSSMCPSTLQHAPSSSSSGSHEVVVVLLLVLPPDVAILWYVVRYINGLERHRVPRQVVGLDALVCVRKKGGKGGG